MMTVELITVIVDKAHIMHNVQEVSNKEKKAQRNQMMKLQQHFWI